MSEITPTKYRKLDLPLRMKVLAMMARGEKYGTIQGILKSEHDIEISQQALTQLRKNNLDTIKEMELTILDAQAAEAVNIHTKLLRKLDKKLDKATEDELELEKLDEQYRNNELTLAEYRRKKTGLLKLNVMELTQMSKEMFAQSGGKKSLVPSAGGSPAAPQDGTPIDPRFVDAITSAIQRGDTITLSQMVIGS